MKYVMMQTTTLHMWVYCIYNKQAKMLNANTQDQYSPHTERKIPRLPQEQCQSLAHRLELASEYARPSVLSTVPSLTRRSQGISDHQLLNGPRFSL